VVTRGPGSGPERNGVDASGPGPLVAHVAGVDHAIAVGVDGRRTGEPVAVGIEVAAHGDRVDAVGVDVAAHRRAALRAGVGEVAHRKAVGGGGVVVGAEGAAARPAGKVEATESVGALAAGLVVPTHGVAVDAGREVGLADRAGVHARGLVP